MDVRDARGSFPGLDGKVYLDAATVSFAPVQARDAIARFLERAVLCPERDASTHHIAMGELRGATVREAAILLGAGEDEIALVESTSHGLSIAVGAPARAARQRRDRRPRVPPGGDSVFTARFEPDA